MLAESTYFLFKENLKKITHNIKFLIQRRMHFSKLVDYGKWQGLYLNCGSNCTLKNLHHVSKRWQYFGLWPSEHFSVHTKYLNKVHFFYVKINTVCPSNAVPAEIVRRPPSAVGLYCCRAGSPDDFRQDIIARLHSMKVPSLQGLPSFSIRFKFW